MALRVESRRVGKERAPQPRRRPELEDVLRLAWPSDPRISPDGRRVVWTLTESDVAEDRNPTSIWIGKPGSEPRRLTSGPWDSAPRWSPDGRWLAFLRKEDNDANPQVWLLPMDGGDARALTQQAEGVVEFAWSPDSRRVAFVGFVDKQQTLSDEQRKWVPRATKSLRFKFDGIGLQLERWIHLFTLDIDVDIARQLTSGDFNVAQPAWSPDGTRIAFASAIEPDWDLRAEGNIYTVASDGASEPRCLTSWNGIATTPVWSPDGTSLIFAGSENPTSDRIARLWRVAAGGGAPVQLTADLDRNVMPGGGPAYPGFAPQFVNGAIVFAVRDGGCIHAYRLDLGGDPVKLFGGDQEVLSGLTYAVDGSVAFTASGPRDAGQVYYQGAGSEPQPLTSLNADLLAEIDVAEPVEREFTAPDGTTIHGWMLGSPAHEVSGAPMLLDVHGGPHNAWTWEIPLGSWYQQVLAGRGWIVLKLNVRGSDGYGQDFMAAAVGGWGRRDLQDFTSAVQSLVDEGVADADRLAITGYSYGGYMTNWAVTQTQMFRAAASGGCVTNLSSFYGTSDIGPVFTDSEIGGRPLAAEAAYRDLSPFTHAAAVKTPTLIMHGESDIRCPMGQAEEWFVALRTHGVETELVRFPGASHAFKLMGRPTHRVEYGRRLIDWVERYCASENA